MSDAPRIQQLEWGRVTIEDGGSFKDAKLFPGGARAWDWIETGTHHEPGIQTADAEEVVQHGAEIVILSRGQNGRLQVPPATVSGLEDQGVTVEVLGTVEAVDRYNALAAAGRAVGALIHSTC